MINSGLDDIPKAKSIARKVIEKACSVSLLSF